MKKLHVSRICPQEKGWHATPGIEAPGFLIILILSSNVSVTETQPGNYSVSSTNLNVVDKRGRFSDKYNSVISGLVELSLGAAGPSGEALTNSGRF